MNKPKIVCMGDSLTEGYMIDLSQRWSEVLKKSLGIDLLNSGISGDTTGGMLARFKPMVIDHHPTHVIIMTNDVSLNIGRTDHCEYIRHDQTGQAPWHSIDNRHTYTILFRRYPYGQKLLPASKGSE
jgi:lysophospholipase L1-like esterase